MAWQDGVNNSTPLTNVATLARCLAPYDENGCLQIAYYDSGVGNATSLAAQLIDAATGRGISAKIRNAYSFLSHNYNFRTRGDEIVLVGFSRGAFAVQCLVSIISQTGLLEKQHLYYLRGLFTIWANQRVKGGVEVLEKAMKEMEAIAAHGRPSEVGVPSNWTKSACGLYPLSVIIPSMSASDDGSLSVAWPPTSK